MARIVKRAGIAYCTLHDLRRSFSTLAQRAGVDRYTVKDLGGWSDGFRGREALQRATCRKSIVGAMEQMARTA